MTSLKSINDLTRLSPDIIEKIKIKTAAIIESGWFVLGKEVEKFETAFSDYCGTSHCVSVANGTEALELAIKSVNLGSGKRIATVANGGMYSTLAILSAGSIPVYIDIDPKTLTMSKSALANAMAQNEIDGIIVTHLYGQLADVTIFDIAKHNNLPIIEDCAQSHGATRDFKKAGSFGDVGCFSFYPTKNLGAMGDGGAVVTNSAQINQELMKLRQYGWDKKYYVVKSGCRNSRLDEIQAGILNIKLEYLDEWNSKRRQIVDSVIKDCGNLRNISFPGCVDESYVAHLFIVRSTKRDLLRDFLKEKKIPCDIHYPIPDYKQKIFEHDILYKISLPNTEKASEEILTIPCFPEMTNIEISYIASALKEFNQCYP